MSSTSDQENMAIRRRLRDSESSETEQEDEQQPKRVLRLPSFASIIGEAVLADRIQQLCGALEPIIRKAVQEEMEHGLSQLGGMLYRAPPLHIEEVETSYHLKLEFGKPLALPIFTNNKLVNTDNNPLTIRLVDSRNNPVKATQLVSALKVEVVAIDGDFPSGNNESWTSDEFKGAIVRAREGRRPLLVTNTTATLNDHGVAIFEDIMFTDNSSWIRSRKFRVGVWVVHGSYQGPRIKEALSESFMVKDHRGELYKKHFPPALSDEIWRLKNIGKEGSFDKRLEAEGIRTVEDFLKMWVRDPEKLRGIVGMSDRAWKITLNHARTCNMGGKLHLMRCESFDIAMSPVGEVVGARIRGKMYSLKELPVEEVVQMKQLAVQSYQHWTQLEIVADTLTANANNGQATNEIGTEGCLVGISTSESFESISSGYQDPNYSFDAGVGTSNVTVADNGTSSLTVVDEALCWGSNMEANNYLEWDMLQMP